MTSLRTADFGLRTAPFLPFVRSPQSAVRSILLTLMIFGCAGAERTPGIRMISQSYTFHVSSEPLPPRAREPIVYKVIVRDRRTAEPIENGEGRIFATSRDGVNVWDSFVLGPELGTYYARMRYITAGDWAVAIQFRRDSTHRLERVDWMQDVRAESATTP